MYPHLPEAGWRVAVPVKPGWVGEEEVVVKSTAVGDEEGDCERTTQRQGQATQLPLL